MIAASHIINHTLIHSPVPNFRHGTKSEVLPSVIWRDANVLPRKKKANPNTCRLVFLVFGFIKTVFMSKNPVGQFEPTPNERGFDSQ